MEYKGDVEQVFEYLNNVKESVDVRLILENPVATSTKPLIKFRKYCDMWLKKYPNIKFFGGIWKPGWEVIYHFDYKGPTYEDKYASNNDPKKISGCILDDLCPWIYARFMNKKNIKKGTDKDFLLIDFINIQ